MKKYLTLFKNRIRFYIRRSKILRRVIFFIWGIFNLFHKNMLFRKIKYNNNNIKNNKKAIIFGLRTIPTTNLVYVDALFGHALKKLNWQVKMLYCKGLLDSCDADSVNQNQRMQCFLCKFFGSWVKRILRLDCISFKEYITENDINLIKETVKNLKSNELFDHEYLGVDVGKYAKSSAIRYFLEARLDLNDELISKILRKKLVNAMIISKIASMVHYKEKPDLVFMLHGIYSTWGPFYKYFKKNNIDTIVFNNRAERFGYSIFNRNGCQFDLFAPEIWKQFSERPFEDKEREQIDLFLSSRFKGLLNDSLTFYKEHYNTKESKQSILKSLDVRSYKKKYVLFSNVFWDAVVEDEGSHIFNDIIDWINKTVEYFIKNPDLQLIIKPHPGELGGTIGEISMMGVADYIYQEFPKLTENIYILKANIQLKAYDLFSSNMVGLIFNGTLGLELATQGIPVIVSGNCHYKKAGVVYAIKSLDEYFSLIGSSDKLQVFAKDKVELARKYAYYYFFKTMVRLPFYVDHKWSTINWKTVFDTERLFQNDGGLMKIFKKIAQGKDALGGCDWVPEINVEKVLKD